MEVNKKHLSRELHGATRRRHSWEPPQAQLEEGAQQRGEKPSLHHESGLRRGSLGWGRGQKLKSSYMKHPTLNPAFQQGKGRPCLGGWECRKSNYLSAPKAQ